MVIGMIIALITMVVGFGGFFVNKDMTKKHRRIAAKVEKLKEIGELRSDYQRRLNEQKRLAGEVRKNKNTSDPLLPSRGSRRRPTSS